MTLERFDVSDQRIKTLAAEEEYLRARTRAQEEATTDFLKARRESDAAGTEARVYTFYEGVDDMTCLRCMSILAYWARQHEPGDKEFTLEITSGGGSVIDGFALIDSIRDLQAQGYVINTVAKGWVASMGAVLFQTGNKRTIGRRAYLLLHEIQAQIAGSASDIEDRQKFQREMGDSINELLAERSTLSADEIAERVKRREWVMNAGEAVELGFADELLHEQPYVDDEPLPHHPV